MHVYVPPAVAPWFTFKRYRWLVKEVVGLLYLCICVTLRSDRRSGTVFLPDSCTVMCVPAADLSHGGH